MGEQKVMKLHVLGNISGPSNRFKNWKHFQRQFLPEDEMVGSKRGLELSAKTVEGIATTIR